MTSIQGERVSTHRFTPSLRAFNEWCGAMGIEPRYRHLFVGAYISAMMAAAANQYMESTVEQWAERLRKRYAP